MEVFINLVRDILHPTAMVVQEFLQLFILMAQPIMLNFIPYNQADQVKQQAQIYMVYL